ncbi:putative carbonic anhydrase 5 [Trichoplusia ni]|uniref:Carbonic anhydrase n=1 Tax=Trichoplusia ni TaxID=7111 RepID=A0A7E5VFS2_TRINI|nr:putative carbonic anhydrase 5 [Trichoplusia ni]
MKSFIVLVLLGAADLSLQASDWSYDYETQWPGICTTGQQQSPINIMTQDAVLDPHEAHIRGHLQFRGYGDVRVTATNNGHTLKWSGVYGTPAPVLSGGPLRSNYTFVQFHLHWLSEHAIDGMKYPLEIHFVHVKTGLTLEQALARPDGLAVVGVMALVSRGTDNERALAQLMPAVPELMNTTQYETAPKHIDMTRLLSPDVQSYYTYHGSLTTPRCQEVVTWIVMDKPIYISDAQYKMFGKVDVGGNYNYRSLQPVNRVVYRSMAASCSSIIIPSVTGTLISLLSCLSSSLASGINKGINSLLNVKRKFLGDYKQCVKLA